LLISGVAEVGDNSSKIITKEIELLENLRQKSIRAIELEINQEAASKELLEDIRDIFFKYPGECSVLFRMNTGNGKEILIAAHPQYRVSPCDEMLGEVEGITGHKAVCLYK
jgi:hypothetical protein